MFGYYGYMEDYCPVDYSNVEIIEDFPFKDLAEVAAEYVPKKKKDVLFKIPQVSEKVVSRSSKIPTTHFKNAVVYNPCNGDQIVNDDVFTLAIESTVTTSNQSLAASPWRIFDADCVKAIPIAQVINHNAGHHQRMQKFAVRLHEKKIRGMLQLVASVDMTMFQNGNKRIVKKGSLLTITVLKESTYQKYHYITLAHPVTPQVFFPIEPPQIANVILPSPCSFSLQKNKFVSVIPKDQPIKNSRNQSFNVLARACLDHTVIGFFNIQDGNTLLPQKGCGVIIFIGQVLHEGRLWAALPEPIGDFTLVRNGSIGYWLRTYNVDVGTKSDYLDKTKRIKIVHKVGGVNSINSKYFFDLKFECDFKDEASIVVRTNDNNDWEVT